LIDWLIDWQNGLLSLLLLLLTDWLLKKTDRQTEARSNKTDRKGATTPTNNTQQQQQQHTHATTAATMSKAEKMRNRLASMQKDREEYEKQKKHLEADMNHGHHHLEKIQVNKGLDVANM
jgi:hypothetical protein